ncbi:MAG: helix-turn-helix transcriptional regulator [Eubacteriales bacterium]|nr:helix-turn-helix transcriptional regulator [Eubacteriales bacterium]
MKKKLDLPEALQERMRGKEVTVILDADIATLTLGVLMGLDDIGADFVEDAPEADPDMVPVPPAITIEKMEGDILECPPKSNAGPKKAECKPIDVGKVKALRKAGWTLKAIAEEMGCSPQNISQIMNKEKTDEQKEE